jgi:rifampicin phosphotransferase
MTGLFSELSAADMAAEEWGYKAARLNMAARLGFAVPPALCVRMTAAATARSAVAAWLAAHQPAAVVVRTSSAREDTPGQTFAGRSLTRLNVAPDADAVHRVIVGDILPAASVSAGLSVILQQQVPAEIAGVAFCTAAGLTAEFSRAGTDVITAGGLPQGRLEQGGGVSTATGELAPFMDLGRALSHTCSRLRDAFGFDVDVEWAWLAGALVVLQVRPVTAALTLEAATAGPPGARRREQGGLDG